MGSSETVRESQSPRPPPVLTHCTRQALRVIEESQSVNAVRMRQLAARAARIPRINRRTGRIAGCGCRSQRGDGPSCSRASKWCSPLTANPAQSAPAGSRSTAPHPRWWNEASIACTGASKGPESRTRTGPGQVGWAVAGGGIKKPSTYVWRAACRKSSRSLCARSQPASSPGGQRRPRYRLSMIFESEPTASSRA